MATTINVSGSTYAGKYRMQDLQAAALLSPRFVETGLITPVQNIKKSLTWQNVDDTVNFIDPACDFSPQTNTVTPTEGTLNPKPYEVHKEYCLKDLETDWRAEGLAPGSFSDYNDPEFQDFLLNRALEKIALANEEMYILGKGGVTSADVSGFSAAFTGFLPAIKADANTAKADLSEWEVAITDITAAAQAVVTTTTTDIMVGDKISFVDVVGMTEINGLSGTVLNKTATTTTVDIDSSAFTPYVSGGNCQFINRSNVLEVLARIVRVNIQPALRRDPSLKVVVPEYVASVYREAQATNATGSGSFWVGDKDLDFLGRAIAPMDVWQDNTIAVYRTKHLYLGVDLLGDDSTARIVDMRQTTNEDKTRAKLRMKADVNYRFPSEVFVMRAN